MEKVIIQHSAHTSVRGRLITRLTTSLPKHGSTGTTNDDCRRKHTEANGEKSACSLPTVDIRMPGDKTRHNAGFECPE